MVDNSGVGNGSRGSYDYNNDLGDNRQLNEAEKKVAEAKKPMKGGSYHYPSDLKGGRFYPEQMKISIYEREGVSLKEVKNTLNSNADKFLNPEKIPDKEKQEKPTVGSALFQGAKDVSNVIIKGVKARQGQNTILTSEIYLPMPKELSHGESVAWQAKELGALGGVMKGGMDAAAASVALSKAAMGMGVTGGGIVGKLFGSGAAGAVAGFLASDELSKSIEYAAGIKANPFKEQTFEGIEFRKFSFSYQFNPKNDKEIKSLKNILTDLRAYSKPSFREGGGIFNYPHEFQIQFLTRDETGKMVTNGFLPQLKYCVCNNVTTNFATKEWRSFDGGVPVEVTLQMDFEETELITQNDVLGNTTVGRFKNNKGYF